jgi:hypothetical protein
MGADGRDSAGAIDKNDAVFDGWCCHGLNAAGADPQSHSTETLIFFFLSQERAACHPERSARHARVAKDPLWIRKAGPSRLRRSG